MPEAHHTAFAFGPSGLQPYRVAESATPYVARRHGTCIGIEGDDGATLVQRLRQGLPASAFERIQRALGVPAKVLADVTHIPVRTLSRRKQQGRFDVSESERLFRIAALYDHAVEVMGGEERAREWLTCPVRGLADRVPLHYADTEPGAQEVHDLLGRIEHGVFS